MPEKLRSELILREGRLFERESDEPFNGVMIEKDSKGRRLVAIPIRAGKADGVARSWHDNGQIASQETLVDGVAHGRRLRWHRNGARKSEARIEHGVLSGQFTQWHDNGQQAATMILVNGKPEGWAKAWYASGVLKSRVRLKDGKPITRQFYEDR